MRSGTARVWPGREVALQGPCGRLLEAAALTDNEFLAARDVAEAEFEKYRSAGVSVGGSITAAVRAALRVFELRGPAARREGET